VVGWFQLSADACPARVRRSALICFTQAVAVRLSLPANAVILESRSARPAGVSSVK
jgi:hypothetical protein